MLIAVDLVGYPEYLANPLNSSRGFFFEWKDADGFTRIKKWVQLSEFARSVDDKGKPGGLNGQFSEPVSLADYGKVTSMKVGWNVDPEIAKPEPLDFRPLPPAPPPPRHPAAHAAASTDHCAPGISRAERLRRLAQYGEVRETGLHEFTADGHSVSFLPFGGDLLSCK
jgi:hypothetical protein